MTPCKGLYILDAPSVDLIYGPEIRRDIAGLVNVYAPPQTPASVNADRSLLADTEVIFSGWGGPVMDEEFLDAAPNLRAVFYGSGSIRRLATDAFWERDIVITSAYAANAVPVAEYVLGAILLSLKHFWRFTSLAKAGAGWGDHTRPVPGGYRATVGLVSFGMIARKTAALLRNFDIECLVYCPFLTDAEAREHRVKRCSLEELFERADVISLHTPELPETIGLITGRLLASMKPDATFINTARGAVVREPEMIAVLRQRPDLTAVLDVTCPEPPLADSPLTTLPNVVLSPHIAGSMGREIQRLGRYMVDELQRYLTGMPLRWRITRQIAETLA